MVMEIAVVGGGDVGGSCAADHVLDKEEVDREGGGKKECISQDTFCISFYCNIEVDLHWKRFCPS